jgi:hypothetical protein
MAEPPNPVRNAVGLLLFVLGLIWILLSGGCTLFFLGQEVVPAVHGQGGAMLTLILIVGGVGILPGVGMFLGGRALLRRERNRH